MLAPGSWHDLIQESWGTWSVSSIVVLSLYETIEIKTPY